MKKKNHFTKLIQLWGIILLVGIGGSIIAADIFRSYRDFKFNADQMRAEYTARQKQIIKSEVQRVVDMIEHENGQRVALIKSNIKSEVHDASRSEAQMKADLLASISRIRFGKEGYIFVNRFNGDALVSNGKRFSGDKKLWEVFDENPEAIDRRPSEIGVLGLTLGSTKKVSAATMTLRNSPTRALPGTRWCSPTRSG